MSGDPINVKMKLADPTEVERLMKLALLGSGWMDAQLDAVAAGCVRSIFSALSQAGCVVIQVDDEQTSDPTIGRRYERDISTGS